MSDPAAETCLTTLQVLEAGFVAQRPTKETPPRLSRGCSVRLGAESQNRTGDTAIFSRVLYQLSYLGRRGSF